MVKSTSASTTRSGSLVRRVLLMLCTCLLFAGCSRAFWRDQANRDSYAVIQGKMNDPRWALPRTSVIANPSSRLYDPYDPDSEPLPPDDPAAHRYMHSMNGIRGYEGWHEFGDALSIENPHWLEPFGITPDVLAALDGQIPEGVPGIRKMALPQAVELANIHSREYQTEIEDLYLAALDLTFDRFQFNVRYLGIGGGEPTADLAYAGRPGRGDTLALGSRFGVSQLLPAGGQIAVELANNTLWLFSGENQTNTASVLSYSLIQPLLFGAGRKVVLEDLTQGERNVLYAARDLARFRKIFFTSTVAGGPSGGFLGLLQQRQTILNQIYNIGQLEEQVRVLRAEATPPPDLLAFAEPLAALPPGLEIPPGLQPKLHFDPDREVLIWEGVMTAEQEQALLALSTDENFRKVAVDIVQRIRTEVATLDVLQLETRLARSRNALQQSERRYRDSLDQYKTQLGLPPDLSVTIDESLLEQFELIDPRLYAVEDRIMEFVEVWARIDENDPDLEALQETIAGLRGLLQLLRREGAAVVERDFEDLEKALPERLERLPTDEERQAVRDALARDRRLQADVEQKLDEKTETIENLAASMSKPAPNLEARRAALRTIADLREALLTDLKGLQVIQIDIRVELISLQPFDMKRDEAVRIALDQRLDLMNARARVMDARRRIEVVGNALQATVDVRIEGDLNTPTGTRPLDFRGTSSSFRAGLGFTAPLDQIAERNAYRAALIEYQRARRAYMALEDSVKFDVRQSWRQLEVLKRNFEIARQAVRLAALQYDQAVELTTAPAQPGQQRQSGNQGLNLLNALSSVLDAQNDLIGIWVDYERSRLNIHRDMGIMEIGADGIWVDEFYLQAGLPEAQQALRDGPRKPEVSLLAPPPGSHPLPVGPRPSRPLPTNRSLQERGDATQQTSRVEPTPHGRRHGLHGDSHRRGLSGRTRSKRGRSGGLFGVRDRAGRARAVLDHGQRAG